jgi:preprotein translocase subunit SecY
MQQQQKEGQPRLIQAMRDAFTLPDLRQRLLFTFGILVAFRFLVHVPLPGVDLAALTQFFEQNALLGMLDLFSGGAMRNFSIAAMGVYPYITSSIIMQLLVPVIPSLQAISQQGESGQRRINRITHFLAVPLAALQAYSQLALLTSQSVIARPDAITTVTIITCMTAGTILLVWLGELITERGIGNGISIIIFGGIVASLAESTGRVGLAFQENPIGAVAFGIIGALTLVLIVVFIEAHRRIPVQYARSTFRGGRMYRQSGSTYIPLRVNTAGMIPLIFAIAMMQLPQLIASYFMNPQAPNFWDAVYRAFDASAGLPGGLLYWGLYFLLVFGFTFFYTMVIFEQMSLPRTLQQQGGFVPGVRPGKSTSDYLNAIIKRLTFGGALFLAIVAIMPFLARIGTGVSVLTISSTAILIAVGVALDTMKQLESQLTMRRYDGFLK